MNKRWKDITIKTKKFLQLALAIATIIFVFWLIPKVNNSHYVYESGKPWQYDELYSPFDFAILKAPEEYQKSIDEVKSNHLKHYVLNDERALTKQKFEQLVRSRMEQLNSTEALKTKEDELIEKGKAFLDTLYSKGIIYKQDDADIVLVDNNVAKRIAIPNLYSIEEARKEVDKHNFGTEADNNFLNSLLKMSLIENIAFDQNLNDDLLNNLLAEVSSTKGLVKKGEKIIGKGEIVDAAKKQKLISFEKKYAEQVLNKTQSDTVAIGYFLIISIIISILVFYLFVFQKQLFLRFRQYSLIFLLINVMLFLTSFFSEGTHAYIYMLPYAIVPIVLRAFFKRETALYVHLTIILLAGLFLPTAFSFVFIQLVAGIAAIYGNIDVRYWSQFFRAIAYIFAAYLLAYLAFSLIESGDITKINFAEIGFLALNVFLTFLAYPLIVFFEKMFGLLSDISLVEFTDINKPLLKRLSIEAPGTFQHSLQVSNLAEAAASEIGANSLLVKVGALYHDIGKIKHPIYFIENQFPEENPHSKLSFEESAKIIVAHVTDGIKLAKKYGVPDQIIEFIKTHHGTTRVEYFYRLHAKKHSDEIIPDDDFCYPGPAPFRKEHAILMMADSIEAASKSIKNPTHESLDALVDKIIDYQLSRGQFENVPITFQEIKRCKEVFKKMLASVYHIRIEYPKEK